ncbi:MAG: isoprenylcysteine carboxylmethyltransferase family protein [Proteobacteria bacterium]|nr:isoprenylcysteine carboxylmethyltransferase family protein [Pseudomonadota bacterium]
MSILSNETLRRFFSGRRRFQLAWIFAFFLIFSARHYPEVPGILLCFAGATLRFLASGFLRKEAKLAVGGPYAFTRNPLYLGTFLMGLGATLSVGAYLLTAIMAVVFFLNYHYVIQHEEAKLPSYFGSAYFDYCNLVPRFIPRLVPPAREELHRINSDPEVYGFSMSLANRNRAFEAYVSFVALIAGMGFLVFVKSKLGFI